jgi:hypothetical protein
MGEWYSPCVAYTDDMVHITQTELEELVGKYAPGIGKAKE